MFNLFSFFKEDCKKDYKEDYYKGFASVIGVFSKAQRKSLELMAKMEKEVNANCDTIDKLQERNADIKKIYSNVEKFTSNLDHLLGV